MLKPHEAKRFMHVLGRKDQRLPIIFNALSDPTRCHIFRSFLKKKQLCVTDVTRIVGISMSSASQHLKILEVTGLVRRERVGRNIYFEANSGDRIVDAIKKAVQ